MRRGNATACHSPPRPSRVCPGRLPCGGSCVLPTLPPWSARARGHKRRGPCSQRPPVGRASAARPPTSAPASLAPRVEVLSRVATRCRGAAALRWLLVVPRRGIFPPRLRLPHSQRLGGSPPARALRGKAGAAWSAAFLVCVSGRVPLPPRGGPAPRCVRGQRGPPPRCFGGTARTMRSPCPLFRVRCPCPPPLPLPL